ncbi:hypothetical protein SLS53_003409 [Cytospora paraplurivora]|uniref:Uncharacterized protein n=1 Tax=Cytospora paraplurivora TaxID=2898453 RepID=A0AAN9UHX5_9PEZI
MDEDGFVTVHSFGNLVLQIQLPGGVQGRVFSIGTQDVADVLTFVWEILFDTYEQEVQQRQMSASGVTGTGGEYRVLEPPNISKPMRYAEPRNSRASGHHLTYHDYDNSPYACSYARDEEVYDRSLASLPPAYDETNPRQGETYPGHVHSEEYNQFYGGRRDGFTSARGYEEDYESSSSEEIIRD